MDPPAPPGRGSSVGPRRVLLFVLPVVAVLAVALSLLTAGSMRPYRVARLWGGPTDGTRVSFRVEVFDVREDRGGGFEERPARDGGVRLGFARGGFEAVRALSLDAEGGAEIALDVPPGGARFDVRIEQGALDLAHGAVELRVDRWAAAARRRGGFSGGEAGAYEVLVAPRRGALAVPFEEELVVEVRKGEQGVSGAKLALGTTGAAVSPREGQTGADGRALFRIRPEEHSVTAHVKVEDQAEKSDGSFGLAVTPGAFRASLEGRTLLVESPVPREVAYVALVTEKERLLGVRLELKPDAKGTSTARYPVPAGLSPAYAVVSSDRDLRSPSAVGWPLEPPRDGSPALTFDAVDALLLDGRPRAARHERLRRDRVRWTTATFCSAILFIEMLLLIGLTRSSDRALDGHLAGAGVDQEEAERLAPKRSSGLLVALALVALGFLVVTLAAVFKLE